MNPRYRDWLRTEAIKRRAKPVLEGLDALENAYAEIAKIEAADDNA